MKSRRMLIMLLLLGGLSGIWLLLGGIVIEVHEGFVGAGTLRSGVTTHRAWVQESGSTAEPRVLSVSRRRRGSPYWLAFSSEFNGGPELKAVVIDDLRFEVPAGRRRKVIGTEPIEIRYESDTYRAPTRLAFDNVCELPLNFEADDQATILIDGRVIATDGGATPFQMEFEVRRLIRTTRWRPYWCYAYEQMNAG